MMNVTTAIRQELHSYIDVIPDRNLYALKPILSILAEPAYILETNLTDEERAIIAEGDREFEEHPENFVALETISRS
jgi:adenylate kinase